MLAGDPDNSLLKVHKMSLDHGLVYRGMFYFNPIGFEMGFFCAPDECHVSSNAAPPAKWRTCCRDEWNRSRTYSHTDDHTPHASYISLNELGVPCAFKQLTRTVRERLQSDLAAGIVSPPPFPVVYHTI